MGRTNYYIKILLIGGLLSLALSACGQNASETSGTGNASMEISEDNPAQLVSPDSRETGEDSAEQAGMEPSQEAEPSEPAEGDGGISWSGSSHSGGFRWWSTTQYTQEDYDLAVSFAVDGYQDMSVEEFDRSVMDWDDEERYHKTEEALRRLYAGLPKEDKNADFIYGTLSNTWDACERRHYGACGREKNPWHSGRSEMETFGDVYGDRTLLSGSYAEFDFIYQIADEKAITVGSRDAALDSVEEGLEVFMKAQSAERLRDEEAMEKTLRAELKKLLNALGQDGLTWAGSCDLAYWREAPWETRSYKDDEDYEDYEEEESSESYTKEQYDYVLNKLEYKRHQEMSVADFDRLVYALFSYSDLEESEKFFDAFDAVTCCLDDEDPAAGFLYDTLPRAMEEYEARARTVYSGSENDPVRYDSVCAEHTEDVFGDQVPVGVLEADYLLTYRILDADALTVGQLERFFSDVRAFAGEALKEAMKEGAPDRERVQGALLQAGEKAGNAAVSMTGCEIKYLDSSF